MTDLFGRANGLSSSTKFYEYQEGRYTIQYHEDPDTNELIVLDTWYVPDGEDDVSPEFEVIAVESPTICHISKKLAELIEKVKDL